MLFVGLILFVMLVVVHEFGHFIAAKRNGVKVEEFGIGFPPKLIGKKLGKGFWQAYYTFNLLPLGGFVRLKGENDADTTPGSFGAAPLKAKVKIILAGVSMNFLAAALILSILSAVGMPKVVDQQFSIPSDTTVSEQKVVASFVKEGSPAANAGIESGDQIVRFGEYQLTSAEGMFNLTEAQKGQTVDIVTIRGGQERVVQVTLNENKDNGGYLGIGPGDLILERSTWSAPIRGVGLTLQFSWLTIKGLGTLVAQLFTGQASQAAESVAGPVGVFVILRDVSLIGAPFLLFFIAIISITLGVMNVLPIPALDGGRLFVMLLFRAIKRPLKPKTEQLIHGVGMAVLLVLIVLITVVDVKRFF